MRWLFTVIKIDFILIWRFLKEVADKWRVDRASRLAAALSYYTVLSTAPLIVIAIALAGLVFDRDLAQSEVLYHIRRLMGIHAAQAIQTVVANADKPIFNSVAGVVSLITLLWGASSVFEQLHESLNIVWGVGPRHNRGIRGKVKDRAFAFLLVLATGILLLASLTASTLLTLLSNFILDILPLADWFWQAVELLVSLGIITLLFALLFKYMPARVIAWGDIWPGAAITAMLFVIGKALIGFYLGSHGVGSTYGTAGSVVVFLVWVHYSAQIFFFGAELTQVYATRYGGQKQKTEQPSQDNLEESASKSFSSEQVEHGTIRRLSGT